MSTVFAPDWVFGQEPPPLPEHPIQVISQWSFSTLKKFEACKYQVYLNKIERFKEPQGAAAARGTELHAMIETYIKGESGELPGILKPEMVTLINFLRAEYKDGRTLVECEWGFDRDWKPVPWDQRWGGFILDAMHRRSAYEAAVYDWKSGKSFGNELKHAEQLMFYAGACFAQYHELEIVDVAIGYLDEGRVALKKTFTRDNIKLFMPEISRRAHELTTASSFPANPSPKNCKWCAYKTMQRPDGSPVCPYGAMP
jgi:CRISPR/Cas system-associated exonuclease Cas4 (RecB family)